ncbi:MAG: thermonuclease family protein [Vallitaleaceae bacterium]|nr:thermonuclease family protein [Vallitaleaceae bacterium]
MRTKIGRMGLVLMREELKMKRSSKKSLGKKGIGSIVAIVAILFCIDLSSGDVNLISGLVESVISTFNQEETVYEMGEVVRIVDGDTLVIEINGTDEKVRLIGVDTPESVGKYKNNPEPYGEKASAFTKELILGEEVYLEKDVSETDRYDRLLRYVWLGEPSPNDEADIKKNMINAILLMEGYANVMTITPDVKYAESFLSLEQKARDEDAGLWGLENDE